MNDRGEDQAASLPEDELDRTVAVPRAHDDTIAVPRVNDDTIAVRRSDGAGNAAGAGEAGGADGAGADYALDGTIVVTPGSDSAGDDDLEHTIAVRREDRPDPFVHDGTIVVNPVSGLSASPPPPTAVPDTEVNTGLRRDRERLRGATTRGTGSRGDRLSVTAGSALDPQRPIAPVPGMMPWDELPVGERGVSPAMPVSYGPRWKGSGEADTGVDFVQSYLGPAPPAVPVAVREGREQLPSLRRRDRVRRPVTLAIYAALTVGCLAGFWVVLQILLE